jgi:5-methylcytosine-specific restriction endonuclease McrA
MASNERAIVNNLNERARFFAGPDAPQLTIYDVRAVLDFYNRTCLKCGKTPATSIDHVKPLSLGGENVIENCQLLCTEDNKGKGDSEADYRQGKVLTRELVPQTNEIDTTGKHIDWDRIRTRYITEEISTRELAEQEEINEKTVAQRAYRGNWVGLRDNYCRKLSSQVVQTLAEQEINARVIAGHTAKAVIESWTYSPRQEAKASDALDAAKLLLTLAGQPTEIRELHVKLVAAIVGTDELGQTGGAEGGQPAGRWLRSIASTSTDSPST